MPVPSWVYVKVAIWFCIGAAIVTAFTCGGLWVPEKGWHFLLTLIGVAAFLAATGAPFPPYK